MWIFRAEEFSHRLIAMLITLLKLVSANGNAAFYPIYLPARMIIIFLMAPRTRYGTACRTGPVRWTLIFFLGIQRCFQNSHQRFGRTVYVPVHPALFNIFCQFWTRSNSTKFASKLLDWWLVGSKWKICDYQKHFMVSYWSKWQSQGSTDQKWTGPGLEKIYWPTRFENLGPLRTDCHRTWRSVDPWIK